MSGCTGICNPNAIGVASGYGNNSGIIGLTGYGLAAIQMGGCAVYTVINKNNESSSVTRKDIITDHDNEKITSRGEVASSISVNDQQIDN